MHVVVQDRNLKGTTGRPKHFHDNAKVCCSDDLPEEGNDHDNSRENGDSLAPVYEFVCISFRTDNLNCFRAKLTMTVDMVTLPEPQSGAKRPKLTAPKNDALAIVLSTKA